MAMDKWIEIDVEAIKNNLQEIRSWLDEKARLIAVVKANAYGHGAQETARILCQNGVDFLAVSFLYEAMELRKAAINTSILVFSPIRSEEEAWEAVQNQLTLTITSDDDRELLQRVCEDLNCQVRVHVKIDTGLGRFGLNEEDFLPVCQKISSSEYMDMEGIYTHTADPSSPAFTERQFEQFLRLVNRLEQAGIIVPIKHIANSAVFLRSPHMHLDAVRIGTLLSGQHPVGNFPKRLQLQDPYRFKSRIISVRTLPRGSFLGYYRTFKLKSTAQIAVIPVGFHDGLALEVANKPVGFIDVLRKLCKIILGYLNWSRLDLNIKVRGQEYPVRGKVFMQMALLEIPTGVEVRVGDEVEIPVRKTLASISVTRIYLTGSRQNG